ncbi:MAG: hypothetical protein OEY38_19395 [Gammaproteobacteria bacterium]|nr:hypothetical protein [Gammaproteobacteria bacterium]
MDRTTLMEAVGEISKCTANSYSNNLGISNHFTIDSIVDDVSFRVSVNSTYAERFMKLCNSKSSYHLFYQYNSINKLNWIINITESSGKVVFESGVSHGGDWRKVAMSVLFLIFGLVAIYLLLVAIGIKSMKNETIKIVSTFIRRW